jgi:hypothetical protein
LYPSIRVRRSMRGVRFFFQDLGLSGWPVGQQSRPRRPGAIQDSMKFIELQSPLNDFNAMLKNCECLRNSCEFKRNAICYTRNYISILHDTFYCCRHVKCAGRPLQIDSGFDEILRIATTIQLITMQNQRTLGVKQNS